MTNGGARLRPGSEMRWQPFYLYGFPPPAVTECGSRSTRSVVISTEPDFFGSSQTGVKVEWSWGQAG